MDATEAEKFISELELAVDRLRSLYEQYFMGIEKLEPTVPRKDVDRRIHLMRKEQIRNTAQRFRFQMILQRYNTYQTHWQRICREIENGTYKRHVMRARQRFGELGAIPTIAAPAPGAPVLNAALAAELAELDREFAPVKADALRPLPAIRATPGAPSTPPPFARAPPLPRPVAPPAASLRAQSDLPDARVRELYNEFVEAKRRQNESTASVTYDAVARTLRESSARLRQKHGKAVDFVVSVRDGRTVLKPVLR